MPASRWLNDERATAVPRFEWFDGAPGPRKNCRFSTALKGGDDGWLWIAFRSTARTLLGPAFAVDDDPAVADWRSEWFFSRSTSIYGGAAEVQRDIVAEHLLGLPKGR